MSRTTQVLSTLRSTSGTGLSPSMVDVSTSLLLASLLRCREPYNPGDALRHCRFGLVPVRSPLLGESLNCSLFLWVLRCFSSPRSLHLMDGGKQACRVAIRISADQVVFADPRSFSQLITSFVASQSQGIHRMPFFRFIYIFTLSNIYRKKCLHIDNSTRLSSVTYVFAVLLVI